MKRAKIKDVYRLQGKVGVLEDLLLDALKVIEKALPDMDCTCKSEEGVCHAADLFMIADRIKNLNVQSMPSEQGVNE